MSEIVENEGASLEEATHFWQSRLDLVESLAREGRHDVAAELLDQVTELPADVYPRILAARAFGIVNPPIGMEIIDQVILENGENARAQLEKAYIFRNMGDAESARRHFYIAAILDPELESARADFDDAEEIEAAADSEEVEEPQAETAVRYRTAAEMTVIPLREALDQTPVRLLVDPREIPEHHPFLYREEWQTPLDVVYTDRSTYLNGIHSLAVQPSGWDSAVIYDYRDPNQEMFQAHLREDAILVGAPQVQLESETETGERLASLQDSVLHFKKLSKKAERNRILLNRLESLALGLAVTVGICFLLMLVLAPLPRNTPPQIVASVPNKPEDVIIEEKIMTKQEQRPTKTPPAGAMAMDVVTSMAITNMSITTFDASGFDLGTAELGSAFGVGMSFGSTGEGSAMFFGNKTTGKRFLFVLDNSKSMKPNQVALRNQELKRTLDSLRNVDYQIMLFGGGAFWAEKGWGIHPDDLNPRGGPVHFTSPYADYRFSSDGVFKFRLLGDPKEFKTAPWKRADTLNIKRSLEFVEKAKLFIGTDWDNALEMAHMMDPPPDVIFFMSDGLDNELSVTRITRNSERNGDPVINTVAMQTIQGSKGFADIAEKTGGKYTIVDKNGESIDGFEYRKDPKKFKGRL